MKKPSSLATFPSTNTLPMSKGSHPLNHIGSYRRHHNLGKELLRETIPLSYISFSDAQPLDPTDMASPSWPPATSGRAVVAATTVSVKGALPALSSFERDRCGNTFGSWIAGAVAFPAAGPKGTCNRYGAHIHCYQSRRNEHSSSKLAARDTKAAAKRPLFPQPSLEAKKKKGGYTRGRKNIECHPFVNNRLAYHLTKCASDVEQRKILNSAAKRGLQTFKIIANRIKESLKTLISPNQSAFVPGRSIADNILLTQELMHNYHLDRGVPKCAFKVDIQKAYDTVDWNFLQRILVCFGFHKRMVTWIMECVTTTSFSISINGSLHGYFKGKRGLRQGDPLSPYLFTMVMEILTLIIKRRVHDSDVFTYHRYCSKMELVNLCFADDYSFLRMILPFEEGSLPVKYLGVPLITYRLVYRDSGFKTVISSMHVYWSSMFILPTRVLLDIEQLMRGFLWKGRSKVAWEVVCLPKVEGGLGIKRLGVFNNALMSSHIWKLLTRKESLWVQWIHTYKLRDQNFWDIPCRGNMTWGWRKILQLRPLIQEFCCFKIGDGSCTSIWFDNWCSLSPLASFISSRDIYRAGLTSNSKVSDLLLEGPRDQQEWRNRSGNIVPFSVNEVWNSIRPMAAKVDWFRVIWFTNCIPRHAINFWLIIKKRLRTQDMLRTWDISGCLATNCPLCDVQPDSHEHLFFDCTLSKNIWDRVKIMAGLSNSSPSIDSIVSDILPFANRRTTRSVIAKLVVAATAYFIWQERNYRLFKKVKRSENQLVECIISSVRFKLMTCRFKKSRDGLAILRQWKLSEMVLS
ncbi:putative RNA-directed DNA polymerase [Tanacetum coccineum]